MTTLDVINGMDVASPCKASWNAMTGDDRSRFCAHCEKHVYQISALTSDEVGDLIRRTEGNFCGRLYRRRDGTVLTADCPVGARAFSSGRWHRVLTYGVLGVGFLTTGAFLKAASDRTLSWPPVGPSVTFADWKDWALRTLGFGGSPNSGVVHQTAGMICIDPLPLPPTANPASGTTQDVPRPEPRPD